MANSKLASIPSYTIVSGLTPVCRYEYVKHFEQTDHLLPNTWIVVRVDGRGFTK